MININNYILEKLHINKDYKYNDIRDEKEFINLLSKYGELDLKKVFGNKLPYNKMTLVDIESIYVQRVNGEDDIWYSFHDYDQRFQARLDLNKLSNEQVIKIYDYLCNEINK